MDFTLRPLGTEDAESMWNLINEVKDEEKYLFHTLRFPKEGTARYIEAHNAAGNPVIGAFDAYGRLAGWADMNRGGFEEIAHTASLGMGVAKPFRGMGLGSLVTIAQRPAPNLTLVITENGTMAPSITPRSRPG